MANMTDYEYEQARNTLIPQAVEYADKVTPGIKGESYHDWCDRWNWNFHEKMNELAKEAELT